MSKHSLLMNRLRKSPSHSEAAFTRVELLACVTAVILIIHIAVCALALSASRSDRVACLNNLRQIGVGYTQFGLEHNDLPPWRVSTSDGGNSDYAGGIPGLPTKNVSYVQFSVLSNSLDSPRYLADPGDARRTLNPARFWTTQQNGGLYHPIRQNQSISYFIGLSGSFRTPQHVLAGDRNVATEANASGGCAGLDPTSLILADFTSWTNDVHGLSGNLLLFDGSVKQTTSAALRQAMRRSFALSRPGSCALFPF
jgi:hypothetical protein